MTYKFSKGHAMNDQNASATQARQAVPRVTEGNSSFSRIYRGLLASLGIAAVFLASAPALAATAPPLGVAQQFGALGNSAVTGSTGTGTLVSGDVGSYPTPTITNFFTVDGGPSNTVTPFIVHNSADAVVQQAHTDAIAAYGSLSQACTQTFTSGTNLGGMSLVPGVYCSLGSFAVTGSLILNGTASDVWIFRTTADTLTANVSSSVTTAGGASACNVFWQVGTSATLNGTTFSGTVIADASITLGGGNLIGRALAGTGPTGAVTMPGSGGNTIGGCSLSAPLVIGGVAPTVSKSFSPATIAAGGTSILTITLSNTSTNTADTITTLTDNLPSGMVIAATPTAGTTCGGAVTAPAGGSTVTLTGGTIPVASLIPATPGTCTVSVNVTAATAGSLINTLASGALQTNNGNNAAPASATLTVTPLATSIPTLSEWAMIMLASLLAIMGFAAMRWQAR